MAATSRLDWRYALTVAVSLALFVWFLWSLEWADVGRALAGVRPGWVALASVMVVGDYYARALRWAVLVRHFDPGVPLADLWRATTIGNALNTVLPLRLGDIARPMLVAVKRGVPLATVLTTVVVERLFDAAGVVGALAVVLVMLGEGSGDAAVRVREWGAPAMVTALVGFLAVIAVTSPRARVLTKLLLGVFSRAVRSRLYRFYLQLQTGLAPARAPARLLGGLLGTALVWAFTCASIVAVLWSLDIDLPIVASVFLAVALTVSIAVPQAPGYLGLFQVALAETLTVWGAARADAQAAALVLWAVYVLPITAIGLFHGWLEAGTVLSVRDRLRGVT